MLADSTSPLWSVLIVATLVLAYAGCVLASRLRWRARRRRPDLSDPDYRTSFRNGIRR